MSRIRTIPNPDHVDRIMAARRQGLPLFQRMTAAKMEQERRLDRGAAW